MSYRGLIPAAGRDGQEGTNNVKSRIMLIGTSDGWNNNAATQVAYSMYDLYFISYYYLVYSIGVDWDDGKRMQLQQQSSKCH